MSAVKFVELFFIFSLFSFNEVFKEHDDFYRNLWYLELHFGIICVKIPLKSDGNR